VTLRIGEARITFDHEPPAGFVCVSCGWTRPYPEELVKGAWDSGLQTALRLLKLERSCTATECAWCVLRTEAA
jgi:hypothetical protein